MRQRRICKTLTEAGNSRPANQEIREAKVRAKLPETLPKIVREKTSNDENEADQPLSPATGSATSEGDVPHRAAAAGTTFGVNGAGVKIGVLSDSYNYLGKAADDVASGDLSGSENPNHWRQKFIQSQIFPFNRPRS